MGTSQNPITFSLQSSVSELDELSQKIRAIGEQWKLDKKTILQVNLALDEIFTNVVSYGIQSDSSQCIDFSFVYRDNEIEIVICDRGKPFDPTQAAEPDIGLPLDEQHIGGLGIFLIRQYTDTITYERVNGKNILTLTKKIQNA